MTVQINYYRRGSLGNKISGQCKQYVTSVIQQNTIIYTHYTNTNISFRYWKIIYYTKGTVILFIFWSFGSVLLYFGSLVQSNSTSQYPSCFLVTACGKSKSRYWRSSCLRYVQFKDKINKLYFLIILTFQYFMHSGKFIPNFPFCLPEKAPSL
jgi:hypothetical protein